MSTTASDIRRMALEEAAVEMCGYCSGIDGIAPVPIKTPYGAGYWHMLTYANGANKCQSSPIWEMVEAEKELRQKMRGAK